MKRGDLIRYRTILSGGKLIEILGIILDEPQDHGNGLMSRVLRPDGKLIKMYLTSSNPEMLGVINETG